jgi:hypothetical protein
MHWRSGDKRMIGRDLPEADKVGDGSIVGIRPHSGARRANRCLSNLTTVSQQTEQLGQQSRNHRVRSSNAPTILDG